MGQRYAILLSHQSGITCTVEHDLLDVLRLEELLDGLFRYPKRIDQIVVRAIIDLNKAQMLPIDMEVVFTFEVHGYGGDLFAVPSLDQRSQSCVRLYKCIIHHTLYVTAQSWE